MDNLQSDSDSDDNIPLCVLANKILQNENEHISEVNNNDVQFKSVPVESSYIDEDNECVLQVFLQNDEATSFMIFDNMGQLLANVDDDTPVDTPVTVDTGIDRDEALSQIPECNDLSTGSFDYLEEYIDGELSLDDSIGSEIEIGLMNNDSERIFESVKSVQQDIDCSAESRDTSGSEYIPSESERSSESESDNPEFAKSKNRPNLSRKRFNQNHSCDIHSYAKPKEIHISRKRKRDKESWDREIRKRRRQHGKEYENAKGKRVPMKKPKYNECFCKFKCRSKVDETKQEEICEEYWKLDYEHQRGYICHHVKRIDKRRNTVRKGTSRRKYTYEYFFVVNQEKVQVCKKFFQSSLAITEKTIRYTMEKNEPYVTKDKRGRHQKKVIPNCEKDIIREHIRQFPTVESHYCRKNTQRRYLDKELNIKKMYRMYVEKCQSENKPIQKAWLYEKIFNTEFNLGFHEPKKDLCSFCETYKNLTGMDKASRELDYMNHQERKESVRKIKETDKIRATEDRNIRVINFDLQKVLICPKTEIGEAYYSRKLSTYNFTVFDVVSKEANCFMWYESIAKRGSNEIASAIFKFNTSVGEVNELIYYSDSCTGQQRNLPFSAMCLYSVQNLPITKITHHYFERGHSQMEGDSVHAMIEKSTKKKEIFSPQDWMLAVRNSKVTNPRYKVVEIATDDVKDFKQMAAETISNRNRSADGSTLQWNKVHTFEYKKSEPEKIFFRYDFKEDFNYIEVRSSFRRRKLRNMKCYQLKPAYTGKIPIARLKYNDLIYLCKNNIIPSNYHSFYTNLPHTEAVESDSE